MIKLIIRILLKTKEDCRGPICSSNGIKTELVVYVLHMKDIINLTLVSVSTDVVQRRPPTFRSTTELLSKLMFLKLRILPLLKPHFLKPVELIWPKHHSPFAKEVLAFCFYPLLIFRSFSFQSNTLDYHFKCVPNLQTCHVSNTIKPDYRLQVYILNLLSLHEVTLK